MEHFKFMNWRIGEFVFWCHEQVINLHRYFIIILYIFFSRCQKKLTVGVTDESMLKSKKLNDLIEPVEKRIAVVSQFLKGTLENKFPSGVIQQLCGPNI